MIALSHITKTYRMGHVDVQALNDVSLQIERGEFIAISGPSGSGKSTLMHVLGLLDVPDKGSFRLNGREVRDLSEDERADLRSATIGFVFQQFNLLSRVSAQGNVALPLIYSDADTRESPDELLDRVGLGDRKEHVPTELSGGQQQRVAIARALVNKPAIIMADEPTGNLDSSSAEEIMGLLRALHRTGLTVVIVTHDAEIARKADRCIAMKDGRIVKDTGRRETPAVQSDPGYAAAGESRARSRTNRLARRIHETAMLLRQAGVSLMASKTRTALSMLGVLIGVAAVISVMALGTGAKLAVQDRISSMGANLLVLMPQSQQSRGVSLGVGNVSRLTLDDAKALRALKGVKQVSAGVRGSVQALYGNQNWRTSLRGVEPEYEAIHMMTPAAGRFFTEAEVDARSRVAVIGVTVAQELFGSENPLGKTVRLNRDAFEVIGLLPDKGSSAFMDENDQVLIPVTTAMKRILGEKYLGQIEIQAESSDYLDYIQMAAVDAVSRRHRVATDQFRTMNMADIQEMMTSTSRTMSVLLIGIGAVSLLVGGIGIMNIMLVSVTERTREIGIRKAVGARRADILLQFLVESLVVSAWGGLLGLALGSGVSLAMNRLAGWAVGLQPLTLLTAFSFSVLVGVVFGLWPAQKASAMEPMEALRYE